MQRICELAGRLIIESGRVRAALRAQDDAIDEGDLEKVTHRLKNALLVIRAVRLRIEGEKPVTAEKRRKRRRKRAADTPKPGQDHPWRESGETSSQPDE